MANIDGTNGRDVVSVNQGDTFRALGGDDEITLLRGATGQGDAGNDTLIVAPDVDNLNATVWYWSSPKVIYVDLKDGYALDGFGGRDTLINVHNVHGFKQDGDRGYGSSEADRFWIGPGQNVSTGTIYIDGRGGYDRVTLGINPDQKRGELVVSASADGRLVTAYNANTPGLRYLLRDVEMLNVWTGGQDGYNIEYDISGLRDLSQAGQDILLRQASGWQTLAKGSPLTLTYGFLSRQPLLGAEGGTGFQAYTTTQKDVVRSVFAKLELQTGLTFLEVAPESAQLRFGINQQTNTRGYSFLPDQYRNDERGGDVWLDLETAAVMNPGQEGFFVLLHEIGHALGLQHPLDESDTSGATVLLDSLAQYSNTIMLDGLVNSPSQSWPRWYGSFDLQALRYLYGAKAYSPGNDTYTVNDDVVNSFGTPLDDGGDDTLNASASSVSVHIDLRSGQSSSIGLGADGKANYRNLVIASGTKIENVIASAYDDSIMGNELDNYIESRGGNDITDAGAGLDTVRLIGKSNQTRVYKAAYSNTWNAESVSGTEGGPEGSIELTNVERLRFDNIGLALDTGGSETAGQAAKAVGIIFGKDIVNNSAVMGIALDLMDNQAISYPQLVELALQVRLRDQAQNPWKVVDLLYANLTGVAPDSIVLNSLAGLITDRVFTVQTLCMAAAELELNLVNINLTGLSQTGLLFDPYAA